MALPENELSSALANTADAYEACRESALWPDDMQKELFQQFFACVAELKQVLDKFG